MKLLFIILDGLGDRPHQVLEGYTPLEAAHTPNMDKLAASGMTGLIDVIQSGIVPGSDTAHMALFGIDPYSYYTGRGPFEAAGLSLDVLPGDIAFRANFSTLSEDGLITDRRAGRIKEGTKELEEILQNTIIEGVEIIFKAGVEHRAALILRGEGLSDKVEGNDPKKEGKAPYSFKPLNDSEEALKTARILTEFAKQSNKLLNAAHINKERKISGLPLANYLLIRGAGKVPSMPNFEKEFGLKAVCVAGGGLYKGVARMAGMTIIEDRRLTGGENTDLSAKFQLALDSMKSYDFIFVHVKGTDNLGHDGKAKEKKEFIEKIDKELYRFLPESLQEEVVVMITGDHSTPCVFKEHSADPVPVLIYAPNCRKDDVTEFGERYVAKGILGKFQGKNLMGILLNEMGILRKYGA